MHLIKGGDGDAKRAYDPKKVCLVMTVLLTGDRYFIPLDSDHGAPGMKPGEQPAPFNMAFAYTASVSYLVKLKEFKDKDGETHIHHHIRLVRDARIFNTGLSFETVSLPDWWEKRKTSEEWTEEVGA